LQQANLPNGNIVTSTLTEWIRSGSNKRDIVDFVLLDPPRAGAESAVIQGILQLKPKKTLLRFM
jgi:tRNA/tmRNA/rRNA uracil-C5-methylase (TrmA/RlmC/RlmD family)